MLSVAILGVVVGKWQCPWLCCHLIVVLQYIILYWYIDSMMNVPVSSMQRENIDAEHLP